MTIRKLAIACLLAYTLCLGDAASEVRAQAPTTRPAARPTVERDWVPMESKAIGLKFRVPKAWNRLEVQSSVDTSDSVFFFDAAAQSKEMVHRQFRVMMGQPCHGEPTLESQVQATRDVAKMNDPNVEFTAEEATEVAGRPARRLEWNSTITSTRTTTTSKGVRKTEEIKTKQRTRMTIWMEDGAYCSYGIESDAAGFPSLAKLADRVAATFERTK